MTYIEEYYNWILENPNKVNEKIKTIYGKLVSDLKKPRTISIFNQTTEENETHTYVFDETLGTRPIKFIELFCKHSKGKWAGKPVELELWQKAFIQALFGFVDEETRLRKYKKGNIICWKKEWQVYTSKWTCFIYAYKRWRRWSGNIFSSYQKRPSKSCMGRIKKDDKEISCTS